jgi:hypothetical protein
MPAKAALKKSSQTKEVSRYGNGKRMQIVPPGGVASRALSQPKSDLSDFGRS